MLVQLPGTLPFADLEPHNGKGLQGLLEQAAGQSIGKLRIHKSGKVTMRFVLEDRFVDFDLNKGIASNFYQDLISLDSEKSELHFIASVN